MRKFTLVLAAAAAMAANVAVAQTYTLNPAPGVATDLQGITITFDEQVFFAENNRTAVAVLENTTTGATYECAEPDRDTFAQVENGIAYKLTFIQEGEELADDVIVEPGDYTLTIKGMYTGELEDANWLDPITAAYTINYPVKYTLTPAAGVATDLQGIALSFPEAKVDFFENNRMPVAVLENLTTGKEYTCQTADLNPRATVGENGCEYILAFVDEDDELVNSINEPGEYLLTIRGMYTGEEVALPVIKAAYVVEYPCAYTLSPEPGVATDLQGIALTFESSNVAFYENNRMPVAVLENLNTGVVYNCFDADRNTMAETTGVQYIFNFLDEEDEYVDVINVPGNYKLTVRALCVGEGEDVEDLPVITAEYVVEYPYAYTLTPALGSTVSEINNVVISFEDTVVSFFENNRMPVAVLENTLTGKVYNCYEPDRNTNAEVASEYTLVFYDEDDDVAVITEPGVYELTIKGMYTGEISDVEGEGTEQTAIDLPVITGTITIAYPIDYLLDPANEAVVGEISKVTVDFYNNKDVVFVVGNRASAVITNGLEGDDEVVFTCQEATMDPRAESEGRVYDLVFTNEDDELVNISEPGMWYLTITTLALEVVDPETEEIDYEVLPNIYAVYYVDGEANEGDTSKVVDLTSPDGVYNVYSINGTQVVKNGSVDALKGLGKGIYVINGHKVVIK